MERTGIGIIGCGTISPAYLKAARRFPTSRCWPSRTSMRLPPPRGAPNSAFPAVTIEALLADPAITIVVNLTVPKAHVAVGHACLRAGKHVHSEKPLGIATAEARGLLAAAAERGLRVGCAPDTFLGGAHQTCRALVDEGAIGRPVGGYGRLPVPRPRALASQSGVLLSRGRRPHAGHGALLHHRPREPSRARGRGVRHDEPPTGRAHGRERTARGSHHPGRGADPCRRHAAFRLRRRRLAGHELRRPQAPSCADRDLRNRSLADRAGSEHFGGRIEMAATGGDWREVATRHPFADDNYRSIGVADMAHAIRSGEPHRASGELAFHVLEVMEAFGRSSDEGRTIAIASRPERPRATAARPPRADRRDTPGRMTCAKH